MHQCGLLLPIAVLLFLMVQDIDVNIRFARWATCGNEIFGPLRGAVPADDDFGNFCG